MKKIVTLLFMIMILTGCTSNVSTVTFDCGELGVYEVKTDSNYHIKAPGVPAKEGYVLKGWLTENGESFSLDSRITKDITLYPDYNRLYSVYFVSGTQTIEKVSVEENKIVKRPADPKKEDYFFGGWYYHGREFDFTTPITADITLSANWLKGYNIDYQDEQGNVLYHLYSSAAALLPQYNIPEKEGWIADGWYLDDEPFDFSSTVSSDTVLTARYRQLCTVTFVCDEIFSYTQAVAQGDAIAAADRPEKEKHLFAGWYLDGNPYDFSQPVENSIVLVARYIPLRTVTVVFNNANEGNNAIYVIKDGEKISPLPQLSRSGYEFVGWYCNNEPFDFDSGIHADITVKAYFRKILNVIFQYDNGSSDLKMQVLENDMIEKPQDPVKDGYQFAGWFIGEKEFDFSSAVTANITLTAHWQKSE